MSVFTGAAVALITPFRDTGEVDFDALTRLIELQIASRIDAIVVCGTTGEVATLTPDERVQVVRYVVEQVNGRLPVIAGTGSNSTADVIENSKTAEAIGADGLLVITPYYNKTSQAGLVAHYSAVASSVELPIIVYNIPSRTGVNLMPETMAAIMERNPNVTGIKEATGSLSQASRLMELCPGVDLYSGEDDLVLPLLSIGGKGVISTIANVVPEAMHTLCSLFFQGNLADARDIQRQMLPLCRAAFADVNPIPIKAMMGMLKLCRSDVRLPLVPLSDADAATVRNTLRLYYDLV